MWHDAGFTAIDVAIQFLNDNTSGVTPFSQVCFGWLPRKWEDRFFSVDLFRKPSVGRFLANWPIGGLRYAIGKIFVFLRSPRACHSLTILYRWIGLILTKMRTILERAIRHFSDLPTQTSFKPLKWVCWWLWWWWSCLGTIHLLPLPLLLLLLLCCCFF